MNVPSLRLARPVERNLRAGHPWVYRDALAAAPAVPPGTEVRVLDTRGRCAGRGWVEAGPIAVRMWTLDDRPVDAALLGERLAQAHALRTSQPLPDTDAFRLVHGEGDRMPGLVVDRYGDFAVAKLDGDAARAQRPMLERALQPWLKGMGVRGLLLRTGVRGDRAQHVFGAKPDDELRVREHGMQLWTNLWRGQKTGLFLDHRASRRRVRDLCEGQRVLNLYGYTGGFSVAAGLGGAQHVSTVDIARPALELADKSFEANGLAGVEHRIVAEDVPRFAEAAAQDGEQFDVVVADPPNFAPNEASKPAALRSYASLHASSLALLKPGGLYLAASCSSHVRAHDLLETLQRGARNARRILQVLEQSAAPFDHPRLLAFPEGDYLKVFLCRAVD